LSRPIGKRDYVLLGCDAVQLDECVTMGALFTSTWKHSLNSPLQTRGICIPTLSYWFFRYAEY
jgi:hypothetical protein